MIGVGISGKLASGKSTLANVLIDEFGFKRVSMADPLKKAAKQIVDFFTDDLYSGGPCRTEAAEYLRLFGDKSTQQGRRFLQFLGTDVMRAAYPDVWVQAFLHSLKQVNYARVVVDDVRFENEAAVLADGGFYLCRVEMDELARRERISRLYPGYDTANLSHPSETGLDNWKDWAGEFDGAGPIEKFRQEAREWVSWIITTHEVPF